MKNDNPNQEIEDVESVDTAESTLAPEIKEEAMDHQPEVRLLGLARLDKSFHSTRVSV